MKAGKLSGKSKHSHSLSLENREGGSMVRALVSHQYGPASNSRLYASYMS